MIEQSVNVVTTRYHGSFIYFFSRI